MEFEREGRKYKLILGSDLDRDTIFLELRDITEGEAGVVILFGEKNNEGEYRVLVDGYDALWNNQQAAPPDARQRNRVSAGFFAGPVAVNLGGSNSAGRVAGLQGLHPARQVQAGSWDLVMESFCRIYQCGGLGKLVPSSGQDCGHYVNGLGHESQPQSMTGGTTNE